MNNLTVTTSSAPVFLTDADNLGLGTINAGANAVRIESLAGNLTNNTSAITASDLTLVANASGKAIGVSGTPINTAVSGNLTASANSGAGGIYLSDTNGGGTLTISSIDANTGNIELTSTDKIRDVVGVDTTTDIAGANLTIISAAQY